MSFKERIDWRSLQATFANGSPVLAIGPGCHRIGYLETEEWQGVVARAGLVWRQLGERGASAEEVEARREFFVRYWAGQLGIPARCVDGKPTVELPPKQEIRDSERTVPRRERARIALAADLLCALADATGLLGAAITSGAVPVTDWQRFGASVDGSEEGPAALRQMTVQWLQRATRIAADLEDLQLDEEKKGPFPGLAERGLDGEDAAEDTLHLLKARSIHVGLEDLLKQRFDTPDAEFSGAIIEWLSDLLWHVLVAGSRVPPSQDELSFFLNLQADKDNAARRFSRPHPGEYRGPKDDGESLRSDLGALLANYDSGIEPSSWDWSRPRESFSLTMAASLLEIAAKSKREGRYAIALVSDFDLMLERALFELIPDGEAFHVIAPAVLSPAPDKGGTAFRWLYGTVRKGIQGRGGSIEAPQWQWLLHVGTAPTELPQGPVILRLTGSPLFEMGSVRELGLQRGLEKDPGELTAAAVFSEHDSVRAVMELTSLLPSSSKDERLVHRLFGPAGLTWSGRSWLFFGHRFSDWLPRLQLLVTALMLTDEARPFTPQVWERNPQIWDAPDEEEEAAPQTVERKPRIAVAREFDWPEQALLSALEIEMREADLDGVSRYFKPRLAHTGSGLKASRTTVEFLKRVRGRVEELRASGPPPPGGSPVEGPAVPAKPSGGASVRPEPPAVFISYSHEDEPLESEWNRSVKGFADELSRAGIEVQLDQYGNHLGRDWNTWGPAAVEVSDIVICVASPGYATKWRDTFGSGVANEARTIRRALDAGELKGVLFVVLPGRSSEDIPDDMRAIHHSVVERLDLAGVEGVVRLLTDQPEYVRPPVGAIPKLDPIS